MLRPFPVPVWSKADRARIARQCKERVRVLGSVAGRRVWSKAEDEILRRCKGNYKEMERRLPHRTRSAIEMRAERLGLRPRRSSVAQWTGAEEKRLKAQYQCAASVADLLPNFPGRSLYAIRHRASALKLKRRDWTYKPARSKLVNVVRERCLVLGYTMRDLDEIAGTGRYFQSRAWAKSRHPSPKAVFRAVRALGGKLRVEWID